MPLCNCDLYCKEDLMMVLICGYVIIKKEIVVL